VDKNRSQHSTYARYGGLAAAARGREHRDEAERMKEAAPEDSQASSGSRIFAIIARACCLRSSMHLRNHRKSLLPPFLDEFLHGSIAHVVIQADIALRNDHSHNLEIVCRPGFARGPNRLDAMFLPIPVKVIDHGLSKLVARAFGAAWQPAITW
jgi:hypothetical protein